MALDAVFFDLDGTLLDTAGDFIFVVNQLRANKQLPPLADDKIRAQVSNGASALTTLALDIGSDNPSHENARQELLALYSQHLGNNTVFFPGMPETLNWLQNNKLPWGIITNKPVAYTEPLLARTHFAYPPQTVICPDHVTERKPHPESLLLACQHTNSHPQNCLYFGDHLRDIEAGRNAGMQTVACAYGYTETDDAPASWQANHIIHCASEAPSLLESYLS